MHQRCGTPVSRHTPRISPSALRPHIGLSCFAGALSGPSSLRNGSRASPYLVQEAVPRIPGEGTKEADSAQGNCTSREMWMDGKPAMYAWKYGE